MSLSFREVYSRYHGSFFDDIGTEWHELGDLFSTGKEVVEVE